MKTTTIVLSVAISVSIIALGVGCADDASDNPSAPSPAETSSVSAAHAHLEAIAADAPLDGYRLSGGDIAPILAEFRNCDNSHSVYAPDNDTGKGSGTAGTRATAMKNAVVDALKNEILGQFTCRVCPDTEGERCDPFFGKIYTGGAYFTNPSDCTYDDRTRKWTCDGEVDFSLFDGFMPHAEAGCKKCPEKDDKEPKDPVSTGEHR